MVDVTGDREDLRRACERLRSLPESRLTRSAPGLGTPSVAAEVHDLCCSAVVAQGLTHPVPRLSPLASGDQLAVIGRGFLDWLQTQEGAAADAALQHWRVRLRRLRDAL